MCALANVQRANNSCQAAVFATRAHFENVRERFYLLVRRPVQMCRDHNKAVGAGVAQCWLFMYACARRVIIARCTGRSKAPRCHTRARADPAAAPRDKKDALNDVYYTRVHREWVHLSCALCRKCSSPPRLSWVWIVCICNTHARTLGRKATFSTPIFKKDVTVW